MVELKNKYQHTCSKVRRGKGGEGGKMNWRAFWTAGQGEFADINTLKEVLQEINE